MANKQKVLDAIIKAYMCGKEVIDMMDEVNAERLGMEEEQFSEAMFRLQEEGIICGAMFEDDNPQMITLWDDIRVNTIDITAK